MTDILIFLVIFFAAFTQGSVGFGFGLVSMGLLPFFVSEHFAVPFVAPYTFVTAALVAWGVRKHIRWARVWPLLIGVVVGVPFGVLAVKVANPLTIKLILGVTLIGYSIWALFGASHTHERQLHVGWGCLAGTASGVLGAFNTGGPPAVVYTTVRNWDKDATKSTLQVIFAVTAVIQLTGFAMTGLLSGEVLLKNLMMLPALVLGVLVGHALYKRIDQVTFKRVLLVLLLVVGVVYVHKAVTNL